MNTSTNQSDHLISNSPARRLVDDIDLLQRNLLTWMSDGVILIDSNGKIRAWNKKLESLTGLLQRDVEDQLYDPAILGLTEVKSNRPIVSETDPAFCSIRSQNVVRGEYEISGRSGRESKVEVTAIPVLSGTAEVRGCIVMVHDFSLQLDLQRQLRDLHAFSKLDPLTQVANRAEFERALDQFAKEREQTSSTCSLIICDIDFFKHINDNFNHHVGDQALIAFARLLKKFVRQGDVVARFGGEEFVILCANCDSRSAAERAEEIRAQLAQTPMTMLNGKCITASFGVSQLRSDDTATDFFVRADTALIRAKEQGRNRVITSEAVDAEAVSDFPDYEMSPGGIIWPKLKGAPLTSDQFRTRTPIPLLVEKLRGFIIDADAEIRTVRDDFASLIVEFEDPADYSRKGRFEVEIDFQEDTEGEQTTKHGRRKYTYLRVTIRLAKRKWFSTNIPDLAPELLQEIRRYFMIQEDSDMISSRQSNPQESR